MLIFCGIFITKCSFLFNKPNIYAAFITSGPHCMFAITFHFILVQNRPYYKNMQQFGLFKAVKRPTTSTRLGGSNNMNISSGYYVQTTMEMWVYRYSGHTHRRRIKAARSRTLRPKQYAWRHDFDELRHAKVMWPAVYSAWTHFGKIQTNKQSESTAQT